MANDLSTPLTGRKRKPGETPRGFPLARVLFAVIALIGLGLVLRLILANDPLGGRPSRDVAITSTRNANDLANAVASGPVTITADPRQFPAGGSITTIGTDAGPSQPDAFGALAELSEETADGPIPRIAADGRTPFATYSRPSTAPAGLPKVAIIVSGLGINEQGSLERKYP